MAEQEMTESKVEVTGFLARNYDLLLQLVSFGRYGRILKDVISAMEIQPEDSILDLGCGTGKNACLMANFLSHSGQVTGLDIGEEMISQFKTKCTDHPNIFVKKMRIEEPLPFQNEFDKVFLSFVFHGFPDKKRNQILLNSKKALKKDGQLIIFDFNEFNLASKPFWFRTGFKRIECPLAFEYIKIDWKERLRKYGFNNFKEKLFFLDTIRLLIAFF